MLGKLVTDKQNAFLSIFVRLLVLELFFLILFLSQSRLDLVSLNQRRRLHELHALLGLFNRLNDLSFLGRLVGKGARVLVRSR